MLVQLCVKRLGGKYCAFVKDIMEDDHDQVISYNTYTHIT